MHLAGAPPSPAAPAALRGGGGHGPCPNLARSPPPSCAAPAACPALRLQPMHLLVNLALGSEATEFTQSGGRGVAPGELEVCTHAR